MRWELNDLARRLDEQPAAVELREGLVPAPASSDSGLTPDGRRMLAAIENLPEDEREAFDLVRIQGLTQAEAAGVLGVSVIDGEAAAEPWPAAAGRPAGDLRPDGEPDALSTGGGPARPVAGNPPTTEEGAMADDPRVQQLLDRLLDSDASPEEVCESWPELLPVVRHRWRQMHRLTRPPGCPVSRSGRPVPPAAAGGRFPEHPRLRGRGDPRPRRHGRGLQGEASPAQPHRRHQDVARRRLRHPARTGTVPAGGRDGRGLAAPERRAALRRRRGGRPAVLHDGVRGGG